MKNLNYIDFFSPTKVFLFFSACVLLVIVFPIAILVSFLDFNTLCSGLKDMEVLESIKITVLAGFCSTFLGILSGLPLAWITVNVSKKYRVIIEPLTELPIVLPPIIAGIALLQSVSPQSFLGNLLKSCDIQMINSLPGIILAMYFVGVPFIVKSCIIGFESYDTKFSHAAECLGANPWQIFFRVTLPSVYKPIINGCVLMFGRSMGIFGTVVLLASAKPTIPVLVYNKFNAYGLKSALVPALLLTLISFIFFIIRQYLTKWLDR